VKMSFFCLTSNKNLIGHVDPPRISYLFNREPLDRAFTSSSFGTGLVVVGPLDSLRIDRVRIAS
jgi:hypothetical protein